MVMHGWTNTMMGLLEINENFVYYTALSALTLISIIVSIYAQHKRI